MNPIITVLRAVSVGRLQTAWSLCKSQKALADWAHLSKLPSMETWLRGDCSVLSLSGVEKTDELSHLVKGIPAWRTTAQGNVQNLLTLSTSLLSASAMDLSPNSMIPFVLNGFIPASPCASSCAAAWHRNGRRLSCSWLSQHNTVVNGALFYHGLWWVSWRQEVQVNPVLPSQPLLK